MLPATTTGTVVDDLTGASLSAQVRYPGNARAVTTGPDGKYEIRYSTNMRAPFLFEAPGHGQVEVLFGDLSNTKEVRLPATRRVRGTVRDMDGTALPDALVVSLPVRAPFEHPQRAIELSGTTAADGSFGFDAFGPTATWMVLVDGTVRANQRLTEDPQGRVEIRLQPLALVKGTLRRGGKPIPNAVIELRHDSLVPESGSIANAKARMDASTRTATTSTSGAFVLRDLLPGVYSVTSKPGAYIHHEKTRLDAGGEHTLELEIPD